MNKSSGTLIVVGLTSLVVGGVIAHFLLKLDCPTPDPADHAKYVVFFGDCEANPSPNGYVSVSNLNGFINTLNTFTTQINTLKARANPTSSPMPIGPNPMPASDTPISYISVTQRTGSGAPATMHVTQKVGLNNPADVQKLLALVRPQ
jgi:hypothetical protein